MDSSAEFSLEALTNPWPPPHVLPYLHPKEKRKWRIPLVSSPVLKAYVQQHAEDRPGVYRMLGPQDELLYVGKSIRVKSRVLSYFRADPGEKAGKLIRDTQKITWEYIPNEFSALVREMRLIKKWRPRYNVEHKRKRSFAFIKVTREPAPRVIPVSRVLPDGGSYFGPFPRPKLLALTLRELSHLLGLRDCPASVPIFFGDQLEIFGKGRTPRCLRAETGSCLGPCCGGCGSEEYAGRAELAQRFLEGKTKDPLRVLHEEMDRAAEGLEYEYAALLRDRLTRLEMLQKELVGFKGRVEGLSFVYRIRGFKGDDRLYLIRKGLVEKELPHPRGKEKKARATRQVEETFSGPHRQIGSLTQEEASEILLVARWFRLKDKELGKVLTPEAWLKNYGSAA
jgi:excinuclease ABC subunit C